MKSIQQTKTNLGGTRSFSNACLVSCRKLLAQIQQAKQAIMAEFAQTADAPEHLLRLALNEAEALAWQTAYPLLVFPTLASEKAQAVASWHSRQRAHHFLAASAS